MHVPMHALSDPESVPNSDTFILNTNKYSDTLVIEEPE